MYYVGSDGDLLAICVRNVPPKDTHIVKIVLIAILNVIACTATVEQSAFSGVLTVFQQIVAIWAKTNPNRHYTDLIGTIKQKMEGNHNLDYLGTSCANSVVAFSSSSS